MTFQDRLLWCMRHGNMTVADLARWFDRPDPTVRGWVKGTQLGGAAQDMGAVKAALELLEHAIRNRRKFPVPRLSPKERIAWLAAARTG